MAQCGARMQYNINPCIITTGALGASGGGRGGRGGSRGARGEVRGWSKEAVGRMCKFMYSVVDSELQGVGISFTLTLRECPASHVEWQKMVQSLIERLRRSNAICWHWVVEMQRRNVPHLHGCVFFPEHASPSCADVVAGWLDVSKDYKTLRKSQCVKPINDVGGWLGYMTKHGARSVSHYQKSGMPDGWEKTGRLWGYGGDWPRELNRQETSYGVFWSWRRLVRYARCVYERSQLPQLDGGIPCNKNGLIALSFTALDNGGRVRVRYRRGVSPGWVKISWLRALAISLYPRNPYCEQNGKIYLRALPSMQQWLDNNFGMQHPEFQLLLQLQRRRYGLSWARRMLRCSSKKFSYVRGVRHAGADAPAIAAAASLVGLIKYPDGGAPPLCRFDNEDGCAVASPIIEGVHFMSKEELKKRSKRS